MLGPKRGRANGPAEGRAALVLIADKSPDTRALIAANLERVGYRTREASCGEEALAVAGEEEPSVAVLDVLLPGISGYEVCLELKESFGPGVRVVFISAERSHPADRVGGLLIGADDYVVKPFDADELVARIRRLVRPPRASSNDDGHHALTSRELQVLRLLARGLTANEIAADLVISPKTVATHIQRTLGKLGVHTRAQAVALAHLERLLDRSPFTS